MNFTHFCEFWCFSLLKQARVTLNFCSGMPLRKVHELTFLWFGLPGPLLICGKQGEADHVCKILDLVCCYCTSWEKGFENLGWNFCLQPIVRESLGELLWELFSNDSDECKSKSCLREWLVMLRVALRMAFSFFALRAFLLLKIPKHLKMILLSSLSCDRNFEDAIYKKSWGQIYPHHFSRGYPQEKMGIHKQRRRNPNALLLLPKWSVSRQAKRHPMQEIKKAIKHWSGNCGCHAQLQAMSNSRWVVRGQKLILRCISTCPKDVSVLKMLRHSIP